MGDKPTPQPPDNQVSSEANQPPARLLAMPATWEDMEALGLDPLTGLPVDQGDAA